MCISKKFIDYILKVTFRVARERSLTLLRADHVFVLAAECVVGVGLGDAGGAQQLLAAEGLGVAVRSRMAHALGDGAGGGRVALVVGTPS